MYGWIYKKEFIESNICDHFECLGKHVDKLPKSLQILLEKALDAKEECLVLEGQGEHPEWHHYEIHADNFNSVAYKELMDADWIRVGCAYYGVHPKQYKMMHFEGRPNILASNEQFLKDFAEQHKATAEFEAMKP